MAEKKPSEPDPKSEAAPATGAASEIDSLPVSPVDEGLSFGDIELPGGGARTETEPLLALDPEGLLMTEGRVTHSSNRRRHGARKWIKRILIGVPVAIVLLLLAVAGTLYFAGDWAVEKAWPMVDRSLSKKGIYLSWDSVEQTRERGIVLENVVLFKDSARTEPLLTVGNVAAAFAWGHEKIGGGPGAAVTLDQSGLLLETGAARNQLTGLQGSLTANSAGLAVDQLVGELNGLRLDVAGDLKWSSLPSKGNGGGRDRADKEGDRERERERDGKKPGKIDLASMDFAPIDQALDWIRFSGKGAPLLLEARFSEAEGQALGIDVSLKGADFTWRDVPLDIVDLGIHGELSGDEKATIRISPLLLEYRGGTLNGEAICQMGKQRVVISSLDSDLDLAGLAAELHPPTGEKLKAWKFAGPPEIALKGTLALKNLAASVIDGEVTLPQGLIAELGLSEPLAVSSFHTSISMREGTVSTGDFHVDLPGGRIDAELEAKPFVEPMEFGGQFTMADHAVQAIARLFGVKEPVDDVVSLAGTFSGTPSRIEVSALKMDQADRSITAEADVDFDAKVVEVKSLKSNFDLLGLAARIHPLAAKSLAPIRVPIPPEFDLSGTISLAEISKSAFTGTLSLPGGVIVGPDTSAPIEITEFQTEFSIQNHEVVAKQFHLKLFEGAIDGVVTSNPFAEPRQFAGTINASQLSLASISRIFSAAPAAPEPMANAVEAAVEASADLAETAVEETVETTPVASPPAEEKTVLNLGSVVGAVQDAAEKAVTQTVDAVGSVTTPGNPAEEGVAESAQIASPGSDRIDLAVEFQGNPSRIEIPSLKLDRGERSLTAQANIDLENGVLEIGSLDSNLDLVEMAKLAHPPSRESLKTIAFGGGPAIQMNGTLPWKQPQQANVSGSVKVPEGLTVTLSEARQLQIDDFSSAFKLEDGNLTTDDLSVQALGGVTLARVIARPFEENLPLGIAVQSKGLLLTEISRISGAEKEMPGTADFTLQGNGLATLTGFNGKGKIDVKDTEFYFIPVIGKLLDKLNSLNLGLEEDEKSNLSANFAISEGVIDSPDLNIQLANLDVDAPGWVDLGKEYVDMDIRVRPGGMLGSANRFSGLALEVSAKGPYDQISYDFVGGAAETALGIVDNVTGGGLERLNGMVKPLTNSEGTTQPEGNPETDTPQTLPTDGKKGLLKKLKLFQKK